jgi:hypothetical protein
MAGPQYVCDLSFPANAAISQFQAVVLRTDLKIEPADAQGEAVFGICQETVTAQDVTDGRIVDVRVLGVSRCVANGNLTAAAFVTTDATGKVEAAASGDWVIGQLVTDPAASGDWCDVLLMPSGIPRA